MSDRVMLLIDADNVSIDVIEQAVAHLLDEHGALHVRRAYCTAEGALKHQSTFRRLSIKPMVNLSTGKNSTDIALAVDAIDLVLAERPDVVAIASSDSDFAPLVARLREKGCRVVGIGQDGKTGDETLQIYDAFTVMTHRGGSSRAASAPPAAAKRPAAKRAARKTAGGRAPAAGPTASPAAKKAAAKSASTRASASRTTRSAAPAPTPAPGPATSATSAADPAESDDAAASAAPPAAAKSPARKSASRRTGAGRRSAGAADAPEAASPPASPSPDGDDASAPPRADEPRPPIPAAEPRGARGPGGRSGASDASHGSGAGDAPPDRDRIARVLAVLPELERGGTLELRVASQRLREAGLLTRSGSSTRLFGQFADRFELLPPGNPNHVRLHPADPG